MDQGGGELIGTLKPPDAVDQRGGEDGDNSSPGDERLDTRDPGKAGTNPLGDGDGGAEHDDDLPWDKPLKVAAVAERFRLSTTNRFKPRSETPDQYLRAFRSFADYAGLGVLNRRQLASRGRDIILAYMATVPLRSKRTVLHALACVWAEGLGLAWPIKMQRDFGRTLPPVGHRESPRDQDVRPWATAVEGETDPYLRLMVALELNYGWRPENQLAHARWRWVTSRYGPLAFVTKDGADEGFKTHSRIVAYIPPVAAEALEAWRKVCPRTDPEAAILPWRGLRGELDPGRILDRRQAWYILRGFEAKWGLRHLPPVYLRHWVKTTCRRLSDPALAALQGHQPPRDPGERNTYDTPQIEAILDEQRLEFPEGTLGVLRPPTITLADGLEAEIGAVKEWKSGLIGTVELMARLEALQRRAVRPRVAEP